MKNRRSLLRWLHLALAIPLGVYVYSPWGENAVFTALIKTAILPALSFSGLWLWKGRWLAQRSLGQSGRKTRQAPAMSSRAAP